MLAGMDLVLEALWLVEMLAEFLFLWLPLVLAGLAGMDLVLEVLWLVEMLAEFLFLPLVLARLAGMDLVLKVLWLVEMLVEFLRLPLVLAGLNLVLEVEMLAEFLLLHLVLAVVEFGLQWPVEMLLVLAGMDVVLQLLWLVWLPLLAGCEPELVLEMSLDVMAQVCVLPLPHLLAEVGLHRSQVVPPQKHFWMQTCKR